MSTTLHRSMSGLQVHVPHFAEYATKTAREADITLDSTHVGKIALQMDDGSYWRLVAGGDPPQWARVGGGILLSGLISHYSGTFGGTDNKFPINAATGEVDLRYALCDGGTYTAPDGRSVTTPDLRDKFVMGASDTRSPGDTGGNETVTPTGTAANTTLSLAQIPRHSHTFPIDGSGYSGYGLSTPNAQNNGAPRSTSSVGSGGAHSHSLTLDDLSILPPYYVLSYIMAL